MQIATVSGGKPWICTVYYVLRNKNFYWLSFPERRHSKEIADDAHVAIAVAVKQNKPVIGIQAEGTARMVQDQAEVAAVLSLYVEKYGQGKEFVQRFIAGENQHSLYCMTPTKVMLFDEYTSRKMPYRDITNSY
jgi:uncharacterized protein YhbP (UPF0306 family)